MSEQKWTLTKSDKDRMQRTADLCKKDLKSALGVTMEALWNVGKRVEDLRTDPKFGEAVIPHMAGLIGHKETYIRSCMSIYTNYRSKDDLDVLLSKEYSPTAWHYINELPSQDSRDRVMDTIEEYEKDGKKVTTRQVREVVQQEKRNHKKEEKKSAATMAKQLTAMSLVSGYKSQSEKILAALTRVEGNLTKAFETIPEYIALINNEDLTSDDEYHKTMDLVDSYATTCTEILRKLVRIQKLVTDNGGASLKPTEEE